jgi:hypothetical protein
VNVRAESSFDGATRVISAQLVNSDTAVAGNVAGFGSCPVFDLCRKLIARGFDPALPLIAYRNGTLALRIRSIGQAAQLSVRPDGVGFMAFRPGLSARAKTERAP